MQQPTYKSEKDTAKSKKKKEALPVPKTPGGWAMLGLRGLLKEAQAREKRRLPR